MELGPLGSGPRLGAGDSGEDACMALGPWECERKLFLEGLRGLGEGRAREGLLGNSLLGRWKLCLARPLGGRYRGLNPGGRKCQAPPFPRGKRAASGRCAARAAPAASGPRAERPRQPGILAAKFQGPTDYRAGGCRRAGREAVGRAPAERGLQGLRAQGVTCYKRSPALCVARCRLSASERRKDWGGGSGKPRKLSKSGS